MNLATKQFVLEHLTDDVRHLALRSAATDVDLHYALQQIAARQRLQAKVPSWATNFDLEFPPQISIEQCSSEGTARYKSSILSGKSLVDLTGGLGIDCYFLSDNFEQATYVERQPHLAELAKKNFSALNAKINVFCGDSVDFLAKMSDCSAIFVDPARRDDAGRKVVSLADCTPNVAEMQIEMLHKAEKVLIKLSPMIDLATTLRQLRCVSQIHVVASRNECKEVLVLLERNFAGETAIFAIDIEQQREPFRFTFASEKSAKIEMAQSVKHYLYEPNAAVMKAGAFRSVCQQFGVEKLHINSHLYTAESQKIDFPGRVFEVENVLSLNKETCRNLPKQLPQANIAVRNFPMTAVDLRKKLKIADGGDHFLFATTLANGSKRVIVARKSQI